MAVQESKTFKPTEIWTPSSEDFDYGEAVRKAVENFNHQNPKRLIHELKQKVKRSAGGVQYAVLDGGQPQAYSPTEALVVFNPFANTATANMLVRAEFIREVAKNADIRDAQGKLKPVIMLASPGARGSKIKLTPGERSKVRQGELGPVARELLRAVGEKEYGQIALLGFSQGADVALAGARSAYDANLDTHAIAVGDLAGVKERSQGKLAADFLKSGSSFQKAIEASGLVAQQKAIGAKPYSFNRNKDFVRFGGAALFNSNNRDLWRGLTHSSFEARMGQIFDERTVDRTIRTVVGYGGDKDTISNPRDIEPAIENLYQEFGPDSFISIKVEDGTHAWGDQLPLLAKLYMRALV